MNEKTSTNIKSIPKIDMLKFKDKINKELNSFPITSLPSLLSTKKMTSKTKKYIEQYQNYINNDFNYATVIFIQRVINHSKNLPLEMKNLLNVHKILTKMIKLLMMNEYEIVLFSLLLDDFGWTSSVVKFEDNILFLALIIKRITNQEQKEDIMNYLNEVNCNFKISLDKWEKEKMELYGENGFEHRILKVNNHKLVYKRFSLFKQSYNSYCKKDVIDYNSVVDTIISKGAFYKVNKIQDKTNKNKKSFKQKSFCHEDSLKSINLKRKNYFTIVKDHYSLRKKDYTLLQHKRMTCSHKDNGDIVKLSLTKTNKKTKLIESTDTFLQATHSKHLTNVINQFDNLNQDNQRNINENDDTLSKQFNLPLLESEKQIISQTQAQIQHPYQDLFPNPLAKYSKLSLDFFKPEQEAEQQNYNISNNNIFNSVLSFSDFFGGNNDSFSKNKPNVKNEHNTTILEEDIQLNSKNQSQSSSEDLFDNQSN